MESSVHNASRRVLLVLSILLLSTIPVASSEEPLNEFTIDGRLQMIALDVGQSHVQILQLDEEMILSVNVGCGYCEVQLEAGETSITSSTSVTYKATEPLDAKITISSTIAETVSTSFLVAQDKAHPNTRPSPQSGIELVDSKRCSNSFSCLDVSRGNLNTITEGNYSVLGFDAGAVEANADEYYAFEVNSNETVEVMLHHASDSIRFDFYHQTETEEVLLQPFIESVVGTNPSTMEEAVYLKVSNDGRIVVRVSTSDLFSAYALQRTIHNVQRTMTIEDDITQFEQIGHGSSKSAFVLHPTDIVKISPLIQDISAQLSVRINSQWVMMPSVLVSKNTVERIHAYPNTTMAMLTIESSVHWVDIVIETFADGNTSIDAPAYHPPTLNQTDWPILFAENTDPYSGELTLAALDVRDVYLLSVDGWVDSEHRLNIIVDGASQELRARVQELDQESLEVLQEFVLTPDLFDSKMDLYITVGPGYHLLELYHANDSILDNQTWSNDLASLDYEIRMTKVTTEIGEEPWFPPSEEAKFWGSAIRWVLGFGMMIPALYLVLSIRKTRLHAERLGAMKQRLRVLTNLLDEGKESPEKTRKTLVRSLQAVATLPWQSAISSWGEPEQSYTTDGTSIAVWNLDPRLAKSMGNWPILLGLNTEKETWEISAFRFDAPYGQALSVERVEPRLLHQGEEVFIDTIHKNTTLFLTVDLSGEATQVDIELNGQVQGTPRAMRIPTALNRFSEEE